MTRFLSQRLADGETVQGALNAIPSAVATQALAAAGLDFVMIDREHGPIGPETLHAMIAATAGTGCAPLVRVPAVLEADVKVALDAGAEGILFPLIRTAADAELAVSLMRYPPEGRRGWGPLAAHARHGVAIGDYATAVAPHLTCGIFVETVEAIEHIDAILDVPGIDLAFVAWFDLSTALGVSGQADAPVLVDAMRTAEAAAQARGVPLGTSALSPDQTQDMLTRGYRFLINGFDVLMLGGQAAAWRSWR